MKIRKQSYTFPFEEDPLSKNAEGITKIYDEGLRLMKVLQVKPEVKSKNTYYYDLFYTIIKNRD